MDTGSVSKLLKWFDKCNVLFCVDIQTGHWNISNALFLSLNSQMPSLCHCTLMLVDTMSTPSGHKRRHSPLTNRCILTNREKKKKVFLPQLRKVTSKGYETDFGPYSQMIKTANLDQFHISGVLRSWSQSWVMWWTETTTNIIFAFPFSPITIGKNPL